VTVGAALSFLLPFLTKKKGREKSKIILGHALLKTVEAYLLEHGFDDVNQLISGMITE
jgi:hypothetical protein